MVSVEPIPAPADPFEAQATRDALVETSGALVEKCVEGIEASRDAAERYAEVTPSAATALNP